MKFYHLLCFVITIVSNKGELNTNARNIRFSADLYEKITQMYQGNVLFCPASTEIILALVHAGARGRTAEQIASALHLPDDTKKVQEIFQRLIPTLQVDQQYVLTSANKMYAAERFQINNQYKSVTNDVFGGDIENINFIQSAFAAAEINRWVNENTYGNIDGLIEETDLDESTVMVLVNAMYFKGTWEKQFDPEETSQRHFFVDKLNKIPVDMMEQREHFNYYNSEELQAQFVELPYQGGDVSMTIVLPNKHENLHLLESNIVDVLVTPPYRVADVKVVIPKLKIESNIKFNKILQKLYIIDAFTKYANFSGMTANRESMYITKVAQKTLIKVSESGTTAAASTAVNSGDRIPSARIVFANRPFIFYLKHRTSGILFIGKYTTPIGAEF